MTSGTLATTFQGETFAPIRLRSVAERGEALEDASTWKRACCVPQTNETIRESAARGRDLVGVGAAIYDASALGKMAVSWSDERRFLYRLLATNLASLTLGHLSYIVLLAEDGFIRYGDIISRLSSDRSQVTTTAQGADAALHQVAEHLQALLAGMTEWLQSTTEQRAVIAVRGLGAADIADLCSGVARPRVIRRDRFEPLTGFYNRTLTKRARRRSIHS
jgi:glycine cleavage system aminomethyltransferase T